MIKITGDKALNKLLDTLPEKVRKRVSRQAVTAAATPIVKQTKQNVPTESKLLKKSIGKRIRNAKNNPSVIYAVIGPKVSVSGEHNGKKRWPVKYAHLVHEGHINRDGSYTPGTPFLKSGMDQKSGEAMGIMKNKMDEGIVKEAKKLAGK